MILAAGGWDMKHIGYQNGQQLERIKVIFQYCLMTTCAVFIGIYLATLLSDAFLLQHGSAALKHFSTAFADCDGIWDFTYNLLRYTLWDILCVCVLFFGSFAIFNYVVSDLILLANGFRAAFALTMLIRILASGFPKPPVRILHVFMFFLTHVSMPFLLLFYACLAASYARRFRTFNGVGRASIHADVLFPFILRTLSMIGSMILIHGIYCVVLLITR